MFPPTCAILRQLLPVLLAAAAVSACNGGSDGSATHPHALLAPDSPSGAKPVPVDPEPDGTPAPAPTPTPTPTATPSPRQYSTGVLLFEGSGVWTTESQALRRILEAHGISYDSVGSSELNAMTVDQLDDYGMILWPGGSGTQQANSIASQTRTRLQDAVNNRGVGFLGFCAGAFMVVTPLDIVDYPTLDYYYLEYQGTYAAMTLESFPDGSKRDLLWYGGPVTPDYPGGVIARYPTGDPAISQTYSGKGLVILSGPHPSVNGSVAGLNDSDGTDTELTYQLIRAVLEVSPMPTF